MAFGLQNRLRDLSAVHLWVCVASILKHISNMNNVQCSVWNFPLSDNATVCIQSLVIIHNDPLYTFIVVIIILVLITRTISFFKLSDSLPLSP